VKIDLAPALIPIVLLEAPPLVDPPLPEFIWAAGMKQQTPTKVADIDGVSGGPIFGIERLAEGWRYHLAGIQSGWLPKSRVVTFYPAMPFLDSMAKIIRQAKAQVEGRESPRQDGLTS